MPPNQVSPQPAQPSARPAPAPAPAAAPKTTQTTTTAPTNSTAPARSGNSMNTPSTAPNKAQQPTQQSIQPAPAPAPAPAPVPAPTSTSTSTPRPIRPAQPQSLKFPVDYVPAYTGPQNQPPRRGRPPNGTGNKNQRNGFNTSATTATTSKHYASRIAKEEEERRKNFYNILGDLDPYKGTPKEFIHLLVRAAMRDEEIAKAIRRLNDERLQDPSSWTPVRPYDPSSSQPALALNHQFGTPNQQQSQQQQSLPKPPNQQQHTPGMAPGYGTQQPPMPQQPSVYYVYPSTTPGQPYQVIPGPTYGSPASNIPPPYPPYPQPQSSPGMGAPPQPSPSGAPQGQAKVPAASNAPTNTIQTPYPPLPPQPNPQQPSTQQPTTSKENELSTGRNTSTGRRSNSSDVSNANSFHTAIVIDDADENENDGPNDGGDDTANGGVDNEPDDMDSDDQGSGRKEPSCNFTWVVDKTETLLGWTETYEKESGTRQDTIGHVTAAKLQKLLKRLNAMVDKNSSFRNRAHILTVMREVITATLDTDSRVGISCRQNAKEFDDMFVEAVGKLSPKHRQRLKSSEDGKWMGELEALVDEANRQSLFPRLAEVSALLDS